MSEGLIPTYCPRDLGETAANNTVAGKASLSPNLDFAAINRPEAASCTAYPSLVPGAPLPGDNLYRADLSTDAAAYSLLTPAPTFAAPKNGVTTGSYGAASADYSHVVFTSTGHQTSDAPVNSNQKVFDWHGGTLSLVSKTTGEEPAGNQPMSTIAAVPLGSTNSDAANVVSQGGSRIFFQSPTTNAGACTATNCELYLRENDAVTYWVSEQECSPACSNTAAPDQFEWATPDGSKAFFLSTAKLVNADTSAASNDLYMFTKGSNPAGEENLTLLSRDNEPADGTEAAVKGMLGLSDNGSTVYFAASGQLVAGAPTGAGVKLYRWHWNGGVGTTEYIGTINNENPGGGGDGRTGRRRRRRPRGTQPVNRLVTPSGGDLLIETTKPLAPAVDSDGTRDVYRWDAANGWLCLSCQAFGIASAGESDFDGHVARHVGEGGVQKRLNGEQRIEMVDDGQRVFFASNDALTAEDTNSREDVYEWVAPGAGECTSTSSAFTATNGGCLYLISSGKGTVPFALIGASRSGEDVFFFTEQKLLGWDIDNAVDVYDARVNGGFPEPPAPAAPCEGGACRGAGTSVPAAAGAGSASFAGPGNEPSKHHRHRKHGKHRKQEKRHKHHPERRSGK